MYTLGTWILKSDEKRLSYSLLKSGKVYEQTVTACQLVFVYKSTTKTCFHKARPRFFESIYFYQRLGIWMEKNGQKQIIYAHLKSDNFPISNILKVRIKKMRFTCFSWMIWPTKLYKTSLQVYKGDKPL